MRAPKWLRRLDRAALEVLYPTGLTCLLCGEPSRGETLCADCARSLAEERLTGPVCPRCGHPLREDVCAFCGEDFPAHGMRAVWRHAGAARTLVHRLKYEGLTEAVPILSRGMAEAAEKLPLPKDTVVTWVTMPAKRLRERGVDHGRCLAEATAKRLGYEARPLLLRVREPETQQGLNRASRMTNLKGSFRAQDAQGLTVLLCDDVTTTGATALLCAACLKAGGAAAVWIVTATQSAE